MVRSSSHSGAQKVPTKISGREGKGKERMEGPTMARREGGEGERDGGRKWGKEAVSFSDR